MTRVARCWAPDCDAELTWVRGKWKCPHGHRLRDMSPWMRDHINIMQGDPSMHRRFFGDIT